MASSVLAISPSTELPAGSEFSFYEERSCILAAFARLAQAQGARVGLGIDEGTEDGFRNVLYADLPTGQVSWHIEDDHLFLFDFVAPYEGEFDGHTTTEKYQRLVRYRPDAKRRKSRAKAG